MCNWHCNIIFSFGSAEKGLVLMVGVILSCKVKDLWVHDMCVYLAGCSVWTGTKISKLLHQADGMTAQAIIFMLNL